jgi:hypothetical protein
MCNVDIYALSEDPKDRSVMHHREDHDPELLVEGNSFATHSPEIAAAQICAKYVGSGNDPLSVHVRFPRESFEQLQHHGWERLR